jgi:hypothetical protein
MRRQERSDPAAGVEDIIFFASCPEDPVPRQLLCRDPIPAQLAL